MAYQFSFSKPRLLLLCAAIFLAGVLIFVGGVVIGIGMWMPRATRTTGAIPAKMNPAAKVASAKSALKLPASPSEKSAANPATSPADATEPAPASDTSAELATTESTPAAKPGEPIQSPARAGSATMPDMAGQPFVLQLGAFREQKSAKTLQTSLKEKGYTAAILNIVDEDQRTWHMVRLGGYKDLNAASKAASDFTGKEGIQALVRRSDSL